MRAPSDRIPSDDPELVRLREIERKARALLDRLRANHGLISDPTILDRAEDLHRDARVAVEGHVARRGPGE